MHRRRRSLGDQEARAPMAQHQSVYAARVFPTLKQWRLTALGIVLPRLLQILPGLLHLALDDSKSTLRRSRRSRRLNIGFTRGESALGIAVVE
jgi:hypothetical protein